MCAAGERGVCREGVCGRCRRPKAMAQEHVVPEKTVRPAIPANPVERQQLREDLPKMGCKKFLDLPLEMPS